DIIALVDHRIPPGALQVVLELNSEGAIVEDGVDATVDLAAREDISSPFAQRDNVLHAIRLCAVTLFHTMRSFPLILVARAHRSLANKGRRGNQPLPPRRPSKWYRYNAGDVALAVVILSCCMGHVNLCLAALHRS